MLTFFNIPVRTPILLLGLLDFALLLFAIGIGIGLREPPVLAALALDGILLWEKLSFCAVIIIVAYSLGLYNRQYIADLRNVSVQMVVTLAVSFILLSFLFYLIPELRIRILSLAIGLVLAFFAMVGSRYLLRHAASSRYFKRRVVVLGTGAHAARIEELEQTSSQASFTIVGFLDFEANKPLVDETRIVRGVNDLETYCREAEIEELVVAMEERRGKLPVDLLLQVRLAGKAVSSFSSFLEREAGQVELEGLYPSWLTFGSMSAQGRIERSLKRALDVFISMLFLIATLPVTLLTALAIVIEDRGPVFYKQARVGLLGKTFMVWKFRSMRVDAEKNGIPQWAAVRDPRVTRIGAFIRLVRIDEIPQIVNVLRGEMSFIGPRPERPTIVADLSREIAFYKYRHVVKPGITGWAQINYPYGATIHDAQQKLKYDLYYIKNFSLLLDLSILFQTVRVILWRDGAR